MRLVTVALVALIRYQMNESETASRGQYPLLEGGEAAPTKQKERYLRFGAAGEVKHSVDARF
jgi:hypothetical protein